MLKPMNNGRERPAIRHFDADFNEHILRGFSLFIGTFFSGLFGGQNRDVVSQCPHEHHRVGPLARPQSYN